MYDKFLSWKKRKLVKKMEWNWSVSSRNLCHIAYMRKKDEKKYFIRCFFLAYNSPRMKSQTELCLSYFSPLSASSWLLVLIYFWHNLRYSVIMQFNRRISLILVNKKCDDNADCVYRFKFITVVIIHNWILMIKPCIFRYYINKYINVSFYNDMCVLIRALYVDIIVEESIRT